MKATNIEIYNFLNLINPRLGKAYKRTGFCPLPKNFEIEKAQIKQILLLSQMKNEEVVPSFCNETKSKIKKFFKNNLKNCKKWQKLGGFEGKFSKKFAQKIDLYLSLRIGLSRLLLKDFSFHTFDEVEAYRQIFNLDPILGEALQFLFEDKFAFDEHFDSLEQNYEISYLEKMKIIEKKNSKKLKREQKIVDLNSKRKSSENKKINAKKSQKIEKNKQKIENNQDIAKIKAEIKKNKTAKNKEN